MIRKTKTDEGLTEENFKVRQLFNSYNYNVDHIIFSGEYCTTL